MALTSLELTTAPFADGRTFGEIGAYELLTGRAHFTFDPTHPFNTVITDIDLAAREADDRVHCSADISILRPRGAAGRNGRLLLDVVNRGNRGLPRSFDVHPADPVPGTIAVGDGWLLEHGYTIVACGWQHDVPVAPGLLRIDVPLVLAEGQPITGRVACRYHVSASTRVLMLSDGGHVPYPAVDLEEADATLTVRDHPLGAPRVIARSEWQFALLSQGEPIPSARNIYLPSGFVPGKFYEVTYTATGAQPTGLGLAATRDLLSFLRYASAEDGNPCAGALDHTLAFGSSQSGGFLRTMLRLGLCQDEDGRPALDGMLPHIAGAFHTEINWRFGQPSYYGPYSFSYTFPFADLDQREPQTGEVDGFQHVAHERGFLPKVIYTNSSAEYWYLYGALAHINLGDGTDAALPSNVRIYHVGGTQHGGGTWPPTRQRPGVAGPAAVHLINTVDVRPLLRAALVHLDRWVTDATEPPPSRYPRV
ncbi:MAG: alpha/beta hydrolase domain-containing protein, partial [Proteobacteria bacterium]|nr:alpha/beta hydrolase domain-containing protein [Pseudomonadota bacterium]